MQEITNLAGGAIIGFGLAWMLERWVMNFFRRLCVAEPEYFSQGNNEKFSKLFSHWGLWPLTSKAARMDFEKNVESVRYLPYCAPKIFWF